MKSRRRPARLLATFLIALLLLTCATGASHLAPPARAGSPPLRKALVIRVGVISYDDYAKGIKRYGDELRARSQAYFKETGIKVIFQLAVGSYNDVLDWYNKELVDVAFLTPQPVAELREAVKDEELSRRYVATHATNHGAEPIFEYGSVCYVQKDTPIETDAQLKDHAARGEVFFNFVDPLSLSGRILPEYLLRSPEFGVTNINTDSGDKKGDNSATYTYSRTASIASLVKLHDEDASLFGSGEPAAPADEDFVPATQKRWPVAFFYDGDIPEQFRSQLKKVSFPDLEKRRLPEEVLVATGSFINTHRAELLKLFRVDEPHSFYQTNPYAPAFPTWIKRFDEVSRWVKALGINSRDLPNRMFTLERIGKILRKYETEHDGSPARLALVLSGGGAKCAYQLGAIRAIESELAVDPEPEPDGATKEKKVDIDLVVGTSGGAINALTVALGLTREQLDKQSQDNNERLDETWMHFKQRDFFSPLGTTYYLLALATALLEALLVAWLTIIVVGSARAFGRDLSWLYRYLGVALLAVALLDALAQASGWQVDAHGTHLWWHLSLLLTFDLYLTAACLGALGLLMTFLLVRRREFKTWFRVTHTLMRNGLLIVVAALVAYSLFMGKTLSQSDIVESTLADKITRLVSPQAAAKLASAKKGDMHRILSTLSRDDIAPNLKRDLIITGSLLEGEPAAAAAPGLQFNASLPPDLYFYHDHRKCSGAAGDSPERAVCDPAPPADSLGRFRDFDIGGKNYLLDVVIGSSSIYPIFPSRPLEGVGNIVDGGFAHNSPIEAAVMWKATHIILIEASPLSRTSESYLWQNAQNAFNHLYYQAQLSDLRAHGKVEMFTLRPEELPGEPGMCTFDFNPGAIQRAIERGGLDASNYVNPHFERVPGEPVFEVIDFQDITAKNVACHCDAPPADENDSAARQQ